MSAITHLDEHRRRQWINDENIPGGGLVYVFKSKYDDAFSEGLLNEITVLYNNGFEIEDLMDKFNREFVEILMALIYQAEEGKITRPFAYRRK
ncbi:hypothetical protein [Oceanobacillus salinisoli]|uniref:hypothetical protein n=1 Tax=Oceanobacillus salinisoli TaxID=2678611 RepID=UPI0012E107B9|nr:hypothetical protein [Oceanobacillus salinisoli]